MSSSFASSASCGNSSSNSTKSDNDSGRSSRQQGGCETVRLDVSGTRYEVEKSLLEQYPNTVLACMVSDRWRNMSSSRNNNDGGEKVSTEEEADDDDKEQQETFFVGRDGTRFAYILDYMRDSKVSLPISVSKEALLMDFKYFGFDDISDDAISTEELKEHEERIAKSVLVTQKEQDYRALAHAIHYTLQKQLEDHDINKIGAFDVCCYSTEEPVEFYIMSKYLHEFDTEMFNKILHEELDITPIWECSYVDMERIDSIEMGFIKR